MHLWMCQQKLYANRCDFFTLHALCFTPQNRLCLFAWHFHLLAVIFQCELFHISNFALYHSDTHTHTDFVRFEQSDTRHIQTNDNCIILFMVIVFAYISSEDILIKFASGVIICCIFLGSLLSKTNFALLCWMHKMFENLHGLHNTTHIIHLHSFHILESQPPSIYITC